MLIKNADVVLRTVHGSIFLVDISDNYSEDKCALYEINETGRFLWNNIDKQGMVDGLVKVLQEAIIDEVPYDVLFDDVSEFVEDLKERQFVLEVHANG